MLPYITFTFAQRGCWPNVTRFDGATFTSRESLLSTFWEVPRNDFFFDPTNQHGEMNFSDPPWLIRVVAGLVE